MDHYDAVAARTARLVTNDYSSSFGMATKLFPVAIRADIYNIYGLVRLADEIVDTYRGSDSQAQLNALEDEVYSALDNHFSTNLIVHAFQLTATRHHITRELIEPFFYSMRLDTSPQQYTQPLYERYIVGSAEVVGLMCLRVFVKTRAEFYHLEPGARALGAAFQKVNFLRDLAADQNQLRRFYFPGTNFKDFDEQAKRNVVDDIADDFALAKLAIPQLPVNARAAVGAAYSYYFRLFKKLQTASVNDIKSKRIRVNNTVKIGLLTATVVRTKLVGDRS